MCRLLVATILTSVGLSSLAVGADVLLRVRPHVVVAPEVDVTLEQLVDAQNLSETSRAKMKQLTISKAPAYGERQELSQGGLMEILRDVVAREKTKGQKVHVVVPKTVVVDTIRREISPDQVTSELMQAWQPLCMDCQLQIENLSLPRIETIRDWNLKLRAELPKSTFSIPVDLTKENGAVVPAWISGRLVVKRKVPVAKRLLNIGERLTKDDINWEYRDTTFSLDGAPSEEELPGKKLKQSVRIGDIVWGNLLEKQKAVRRGESVQLRSHDTLWEVSLRAVAQQDADIGDVINLKNPQSNTTLMGEVVGQGEVELR